MPHQTINNAALAGFNDYLAKAKLSMKHQYQQQLAADLSSQQWQNCFQRNVLLVLAQSYDQALAQLISLNFDSSLTPVNRGYSELTRQVLATFDGFVDEFLLFVVDKHRTSCALSNFPDEHKPDKAYVNAVKRDIAELWQSFALTANAYLLECRPEHRH
ncbi:amine oxidase [Methylomonas paludis]|uniref:Amine oxidase n=1 Tax=Methylomonas paludis TaxID=1173101 RepID=A0A975MMR6_9GAMM|nr:amine oxidase [Methylomonas paludis]QWF70469.1 amine oxidase [Methylomonas paludis]